MITFHDLDASPFTRRIKIAPPAEALAALPTLAAAAIDLDAAYAEVDRLSDRMVDLEAEHSDHIAAVRKAAVDGAKPPTYREDAFWQARADAIRQAHTQATRARKQAIATFDLVVIEHRYAIARIVRASVATDVEAATENLAALRSILARQAGRARLIYALGLARNLGNADASEDVVITNGPIRLGTLKNAYDAIALVIGDADRLPDVDAP